MTAPARHPPRRRARDPRNGLNASQAITLFYRQVDLHHGLPFQITIPMPDSHSPNASTRAAIAEAERGEGLTECKDADDFFQRLGI